MQSRIAKKWKTAAALFLRSGALLFFLSLCVLVVACGSNTTTSNNLGDPQVTVTIQLKPDGGSPTPPLPPYWCGAWATQTTPSYTAGVVGVYAKFTQNVNGNPVGVGDASAQATVLWPDGNSDTFQTNTTADGLAVFAIPLTNRSGLGKLTLVTVTFNKGGLSCKVGSDRAAYFVLVVSTATVTTSATATGTVSPTPAGGTPGPGTTATPSPGGGGITPTPIGTIRPGPGPKPTPTPKGG